MSGKTEFGAKRYYLTAGGQVFAEYGNDGALDAEYVYGLGMMLARYSPSEGYRFFYVDHLGSTRRMERDEASPNMRVDYYPYGEALTQGGNDDTPYKFTQKPLDDATGLYYFGARYYDPSIGRWMSVDPLAEKYPSVTPYGYAGNNPVIFLDLTGEDWFYYQAAGDSVARYHWHEGSTINTIDQYGNEGTLEAATAGNSIVREGDNWFFLSEGGSKAEACQGNLPFTWQWGEYKDKFGLTYTGGYGFDVVASFKAMLVAEGAGQALGALFKAVGGLRAVNASTKLYMPDGFTPSEIEALRELDELPMSSLERGRARLGIIADALKRQGYTPAQVVKMMKGLIKKARY